MMISECGSASSDSATDKESAFQRAVALRRQGDLVHAEALCAQIIEADARHSRDLESAYLRMRGCTA
jgi:hypothetical protein